jgi:AcrR family transcriptional regulator
MGAKSRRDRQIAHTREDILKAAARAFARRGFESATMQEIAQEAGYTVASLYSYFTGKQEIVEGLVALLEEGLLRPFDEVAAPGLTFAQRLELLLRRQLEFAERWREALAVLFAFKSSAAAVPPKGAGTPVLPESDVYVRRLTEWIRETASTDEIGGRDPEDVAYVLKGILYAVFTRWLRGGPKGGLADRAALIVDIFLHGITFRRTEAETGARRRSPGA